MQSTEVKKEFFGYQYNPKDTHMLHIDCDEPYGGVPAPLVIPEGEYVQPWSGYDPVVTLGKNQDKAANFPSQTSNIKVMGVYRGIEVQSNKWIEIACDEARHSAETVGCPFGATIVQIDNDTERVIRYWKNHNHVTEWNDPSAHAEVTAIRAACQELGVFNLGKIHKDNPNLKLPQKGKTSRCEIYSSAEPCPMCYATIRWSRMDVLVFAATRFDAAVQGVCFSDDDIFAELATPYADRPKLGMRVYQATVPTSLDAFNKYKRTDAIRY